MRNLDILAIRSLLIVVVGLVAALSLRHKAASTRHLVYAGILFSLVLLPALRQWAPSTSVDVESLPAPIQYVANTVGSAQLVPQNAATGSASTRSGGTMTRVLEAGLAVWGIGCLFLLARIGLQLVSVKRMIGGSTLLTIEQRESLIARPDADAPSGIEAYEIRTTPDIAVPSTAWMGRPVILLPAGYETWPTERVHSVVLHEAAHIGRCDWFVQIFGRLACALYWPNPLVWLIHRRTMDLAEQSADDLVLEAGVTPSRYADDLLQIARAVRSNRAALTTSMALKNDIGRRIEMVLDSNKRRGSVRIGGFLLAGLGIAAATIPAATLLFGHNRWDPNARFADIGSGKSISASKLNNYVATLGDGRKVQLLQIGWRREDGVSEAWAPDGTPIAPANRMRASLPPRDSLSYAEFGGYSRATTMEFLFSLKSAGGDARVVGLTNGPDSKPADDEPFQGGWTLPADKEGNALAVCLMKTPASETSRTASFTFYIADGAPRTAVSYDLATGATVDHGIYAANASFEPNATANVFLPGQGRMPFTDDKGDPTRREVPAIVVSYDDVPNPVALDVDVVGIDKSGRTFESLTLSVKRDGGVRHFKAWLPKDEGIVRVEMQTRALRAAEVLGVQIKPNDAP